MAHEQKPGFMEKIKEKLPGHHIMPQLSGEAEETVPRGTDEAISVGSQTKAVTPRAEKRSMVQKIKDKLSGDHHNKENAGPDVNETPGTQSEEYEVEEPNIHDQNGAGYGTLKAGAKKPGMARNNSF